MLLPREILANTWGLMGIRTDGLRVYIYIHMYVDTGLYS